MKPRRVKTPGRWYRGGAVLVLTVVAGIGAVLSWGSLYLAASVGLGASSPTWQGINLIGAAFPLLLDALILGASLRYVGGVKAQRPVSGWRVVAHAAIGATVCFNAAASDTAAHIPWHIVAPAVWSLIVELYARDVLGELREVRPQNADRIPLRLWISATGESVRASWFMARTGEESAEVARISADRCAAARDALRRAIPGKVNRRTRREITRRLWAGSITPGDVFAAIGWCGEAIKECDPEVVLRASLRAVLGPDVTDATQGTRGATEPEAPTTAEPLQPATAELGITEPDSKPDIPELESPEPLRLARPIPADRAVRETVARMLAGETPSIRSVKAKYRCGHSRATEILSEARAHVDRADSDDDEETNREATQ